MDFPSGNFLVFGFIVEHTVAIAFKIGVVYLLAELLADTFKFLGLGQTAGTVTVLFL